MTDALVDYSYATLWHSWPVSFGIWLPYWHLVYIVASLVVFSFIYMFWLRFWVSLRTVNRVYCFCFEFDVFIALISKYSQLLTRKCWAVDWSHRVLYVVLWICPTEWCEIMWYSVVTCTWSSNCNIIINYACKIFVGCVIIDILLLAKINI